MRHIDKKLFICQCVIRLIVNSAIFAASDYQEPSKLVFQCCFIFLPRLHFKAGHATHRATLAHPRRLQQARHDRHQHAQALPLHDHLGHPFEAVVTERGNSGSGLDRDRLDGARRRVAEEKRAKQATQHQLSVDAGANVNAWADADAVNVGHRRRVVDTCTDWFVFLSQMPHFRKLQFVRKLLCRNGQVW